MVAIQCYPCMNRVLPEKPWWLRSADHMIFTEEYVMWTESSKNVTKRALHGFATRSLSRKSSLWSRNTDSPVRKKNRAQRTVKKIMLTIFLNMKRPLTMNFLKKDASVNSDSYWQLLKQYFTLFIECLSCIYIYIYIYKGGCLINIIYLGGTH